MALVNFDDLYLGRFLRCGNLHGKNVTLTIKSVQREVLPDDKGEDKTKATMLFAEIPTGLVICKTNGLCLKAMFGATLKDWEGKRVTLMPDNWGGKDCIRIAGSPDIKADINLPIKLPQRAQFTRKLTVTRAGSQPAANTQPKPEREPGQEG